MGHIELVQREPDQTIRLLTRRAMCERVSIGKSKLYEMMKAGTFPRCHHIDVGLFRWRSDEVAAWIIAQTTRPCSGEVKL